MPSSVHTADFVPQPAPLWSVSPWKTTYIHHQCKSAIASFVEASTFCTVGICLIPWAVFVSPQENWRCVVAETVLFSKTTVQHLKTHVALQLGQYSVHTFTLTGSGAGSCCWSSDWKGCLFCCYLNLWKRRERWTHSESTWKMSHSNKNSVGSQFKQYTLPSAIAWQSTCKKNFRIALWGKLQ